MSGIRLATLTIGQAPRADITPILEAALPEGVSCRHAGVLDGLAIDDIERRFAPVAGEAVLTSRLLDGQAVVMGKAAVKHAVQDKIDQLEQEGCQIIALLCTGEFHGLTTQGAWLIEPDHLLPPTLGALVAGRRVGVMVPLAEQVSSEQQKWRGLRQSPVFAVASPYTATEPEIADAARSLQQQGADVIVMDCMGFTGWHRDAAHRQTNLPVVLSNGLLAALLAALL
ncbi:AroM family protein [Musicola keenii]|uniref:AroM family protein n=1 Tax=Musicola keenii TaxID=2884250 RepID=UPI0017811F4E|nr:AroM family protein [Musicola keenii]